MTYRFKEVTIRTDNSLKGMQQIGQLWQDITTGTIPVLFDTDHQLQQDVILLAKYSNYEQDEKGAYDFTIIGATASLIQELETQAERGIYKKYSISDANGDVNACTQKAWKLVWEEQKAGVLQRSFCNDYESSIPAAFSKDGKAYCTLYIAVQ